MKIVTQFELKSNPLYIEYLRGNSYWYKILTRDSTKIVDFKKEIKEYQKKQKINKFTSTLQYIEMFQNVMASLK